jgi:PAS domain S-box-containing protein
LKLSKILIVDSDLPLLNLLKEALENEGLSISIARDGKTALEKLRINPPDILITGLIISKISGEQLIECVRADSNLRKICIVVLSGALREYIEPENLNADYCLTKKSLKSTLDEVLELVRQIGESKERPPRPQLPQAGFQAGKVVRELLADRNEREHVFKCLKEGLIIFATDHHVFEANPAACEILQKSINEILDNPLGSHFDQEYQEKIGHVIEDIKNGSKNESDLSISYGDKKLILYFSGIKVSDAAGQSEGILLVQDITRQSLAEESLAKERNFYSGIIESIKDGIVVLRRDLTIKSVNHFFPDFFNKDRSQIVEQKCHTICFGRDEPCPDCFLGQSEIFEKGKDFSVNRTLQDYEGNSYHFKVSGAALGMQDEVITSVVLSYDDITRLEKLNDYFKATDTVASLLLKSKNIRKQVEELLEVLGRAAGASRCYWFENQEDSSGEIFMTLRSEWCAENIVPLIDNSLLQNIPYKSAFMRWYRELSAGRIISGLLSTFPDEEHAILKPYNIKSILLIPLFVKKDFQGFIGFDNCIDEKLWQDEEVNLLRSAADSISKAFEFEQSDREIKESEARYREIYEKTYDMWYLHDMEGRFLEVNPAVQRIAGYNEEELLSMTILDLIAERYKDQFDGFLMELKEKGITEGLIRIVTKSDEEKVLKYRNWLVESPEKGLIGRGLVRDVTDRARLKAQIRHSQRMESMGNIASGISHNFRNILAGIMTSSQLLQLKYQEDPELQKYSSQILRLAKMGSDLVTDLFQFARKGSGKPKTIINLSEVLRETYRLISNSFDKKIEIRADIPELLIINGNSSALGQVFMNICTNARDAMPDGGVLHIAAKKEKNGTVVTIADTGLGMDKRTTEMMFDPFFTTKRPGEGTGLGLSTAYGIVKEHKGEIQVHSQEGQGTSFEISFPSPGSMNNFDKQYQSEIFLGKGEKVLIVDDNETVLESMEELLLTLGYRTNSVASGQKAIEEYRTWRPDIVLLDRNMPEMDGPETTKKILDMDPEAKIILISGYEEEGPNGIDAQIKKRIIDYLIKPFDAEELSRVISKVVEK